MKRINQDIRCSPRCLVFAAVTGGHNRLCQHADGFGFKTISDQKTELAKVKLETRRGGRPP